MKLILLFLYFILYNGELFMIKCIEFHNVLELIDGHNVLVQIRLESFAIHKARNIWWMIRRVGGFLRP